MLQVAELLLVRGLRCYKIMYALAELRMRAREAGMRSEPSPATPQHNLDWVPPQHMQQQPDGHLLRPAVAVAPVHQHQDAALLYRALPAQQQVAHGQLAQQQVGGTPRRQPVAGFKRPAAVPDETEGDPEVNSRWRPVKATYSA